MTTNDTPETSPADVERVLTVALDTEAWSLVEEVRDGLRAGGELPVLLLTDAHKLDRVWAALGDLGLPIELLVSVYAALVRVPTAADIRRGREIAALLAARHQATSSTDTTPGGDR